MKAVIGALRAVLGLDSAAFDKGIADAQSRLKKFAPALKKGLMAASAAAATAGAAIGVALKGAIDEADDMSKLSAKIGVPIEELSRLKYAADLSGVSIEGVANGFKKLSTNMAESAGGNKTASELFTQLGVAATNADGTLRSSSAVLLDVADKFAAMEDGAQKTALAVQLFGRSGLDLIPLLNGGAAGLKQMTDEAEALGLTITAETGKAAEEFNDNISRLQATLSGLVTQIASALAPTLARISDFVVGVSEAFRNLSPQTQAFISILAGLTVAFSALAVPLGLVVAGIAAIGAPVALTIAGITALTAAIVAFWPEIQAAWEWVKKLADVFVVLHTQAINAVIQKFQELGAAITSSLAGLGREIIEVFKAIPGQMLEIGGQIVDGLWQGIQAKWEGLKAKVIGLGDSMVGWFKSPFDIHSPSRVMHEIGVNIMDGLGMGLDSSSGPVLARAQNVAGGIRGAFNGMEDVGSGLGNGMTSAFDGIGSSLAEAIKGTKTWRDVALDALRSIASNLLSTMNFGGGFGGGLLKGLLGGLVGFQNGGSFQVGGAGGIDSQIVAFRASPNERVSITKPGQRSGGGAYAPVYNIDARGADQAAIARLERGLAERDRTEAKRVAGYEHTRSTRNTRP
ncbi:phage tail tape measure protein [Sinorhizobium meliloti]|uniref:phage tail tape measure protein n=1 Tax=Rhizobium meliloti TaxID=382 RepID=UPI000FD89215|nr:phage tail tape measure protein [Sinorhizobium meliloti]RVI83923.1 phage tail tape measure protein [Sinorhizobium meliloti]